MSKKWGGASKSDKKSLDKSERSERSTKGGNFIYKTFLPLSTNTSISILCLLYDHFEELRIVKPSLNTASSEVYVMATSFKGISDSLAKKLADVHRTFKEDKIFYMNESILPDIYNVIYRYIQSNISSLRRNMILYYNYDSTLIHRLTTFHENEARKWIAKYFPTNNLTLVKKVDNYNKYNQHYDHNPNHGTHDYNRNKNNNHNHNHRHKHKHRNF